MYFEDLFDDDERTAKRYPLRDIWRAMRPLAAPHARRFALAAGLLMLGVAGELSGPLILRRIIDVAIPAGDAWQSAGLAGLFALVFATTLSIFYLQVMVTSRLGLSIVRDLKARVFNHMLSLSQSFFDAYPSGKLMARVESDSERVRMMFSETAMAIMRSLTLMTGTIVIMAVTDLRITASVLLLVGPVALSTIPVLRLMRKLWGRVRASYARLSGLISEYVRSVPVLQVFAATGVAARKLAGEGRRYLRLEIRSSLWEYGYWSFLGSCEIAAIAIILTAGRGGVAAGALTVGSVVLFIEYTRRLFMPIVMFSETLNQVQRALASADRIFTILKTETQTPDGSLGDGDFPSDWRVIRFEDVWFRYGEGEWALKGVDLELERGSMTALVGASGGGKSTIVSLLMRFYEPQRGRITIGGMDIRSFRMDTWRRHLGLVLQNVSLFSGTLSENLTVFDDSISGEEQLRALETIEAADLLDRFPGGLCGEITEGGQNLSMGERQLVNFARAVLHRPEVLILDEATSSVDPGTECRLQRALDRMLEGRTALVVAHRLTTVRNADVIYVIQGGVVAETGTHLELLDRGGIYAGLCRLQLAPAPIVTLEAADA
jgi:ATP-binding cassette subfamily B protein